MVQIPAHGKYCNSYKCTCCGRSFREMYLTNIHIKNQHRHLVNLIEKLGLIRQVRLDSTTIENVFQVTPLTLHFDPLLDGLIQNVELFLNLLGFGSHHLDETVTQDHVDGGETFIQVRVEGISISTISIVIRYTEEKYDKY